MLMKVGLQVSQYNPTRSLLLSLMQGFYHIVNYRYRFNHIFVQEKRNHFKVHDNCQSADVSTKPMLVMPFTSTLNESGTPRLPLFSLCPACPFSNVYVKFMCVP